MTVEEIRARQKELWDELSYKTRVDGEDWEELASNLDLLIKDICVGMGAQDAKQEGRE